MSFDAIIVTLFIVGVSYKLSSLTGKLSIERFIYHAAAGFFLFFTIKTIVSVIPEAGEYAGAKTRQLATEGVPVMILLAWFFAPWAYVVERIRKGASSFEGAGWIMVASLLNIVLAFAIKTLDA